MPSSNLPDPAKIPDMSLGERVEKPVPSPPPASHQVQQDQGEPTPRSKPAPVRWQVGDSVLAPWEPMLLYPGVIKRFKLDDSQAEQALIQFDDGGRGWVFTYTLRPVDFKIGLIVHARRNNGNQYRGGEIVNLEDDKACVRFDEGGSEWLQFACLRVPSDDDGPGAEIIQPASWQIAPADESTGSGIPTWLIWVGLAILMAVVRMACREMGRN